ncbi:MAG: hypothetical protein RX318_04595 [bacterium]|nr:hypothetical protein [bacterium]
MNVANGLILHVTELEPVNFPCSEASAGSHKQPEPHLFVEPFYRLQEQIDFFEGELNEYRPSGATGKPPPKGRIL